MPKSNRSANGNNQKQNQMLQRRGVAAAYAQNQRSREPKISGNARSTRIKHRELIDTIPGSVGFDVHDSYNINPGLSSTFPWLSSQAAGWEQYRFHALKFEYITRAPTSATGSVILSPDYDPQDAPPSSELVAMSYRDASEDAPWKDQAVKLEPSSMYPLGPRKYIRSANIPYTDIKTYDSGVMHVSTVGQAGTDSIGKLFVEYDVELFVPQTESSGSASDLSANSSYALFNLGVDQTTASGVGEIIAFDEEVTNPLGITNAGGVFTLPAGGYEVIAVIVGTMTGTATTFTVEIRKNSASLVPPYVFNNNFVTTGEDALNVVNGFVYSDGTATCDIFATLLGSAGQINLDESRVSFRRC